jgi:hypothetical protein
MFGSPTAEKVGPIAGVWCTRRNWTGRKAELPFRFYRRVSLIPSLRVNASPPRFSGASGRREIAGAAHGPVAYFTDAKSHPIELADGLRVRIFGQRTVDRPFTDNLGQMVELTDRVIELRGPSGRFRFGARCYT